MTTAIVLPKFDHVSYPWPTQLDIEVGDFCFYNPASPFSLGALTAQSLYPAASMPHQASAADDQRMFARLFAGVSHERHLATDLGSSVPTNENTHDIVPLAVCDVTCASTAFKVGDLLGIAENGGANGILSQQVALVTDPALAIGRSLQDTAGVAVTTIRGLFLAKQTPLDIGSPAFDGILRETIPFGSIAGASTTGTYTFTGKIPEGGIPIGYRAYVATNLNGPSLSAATMELGVTGTLGAFSGSTTQNVFNPTTPQIGSGAPGTYGALAADTTPVATFALTGCNASALTAGSIVVEILYIPPMFQ